ncbi:hypothetical protein K439DRAFT_1374562 [Ramaria rubella]|nr:hypothetical protein K439DRAFT_1374562 [Ramaria rubella]
MSHRWTHGAMVELSRQAMLAVRASIQQHQWFMSHDNLNLAFRVLEQRLNDQTRFECFTAGTCQLDPISAMDVLELDDAAAEQVRSRAEHLVLRFLVDSPDFDFASYKHRESTVFAGPSPHDQLPCGRDHITLQFVLETSSQEEATCDGNDKLIWEWFAQLGLDTRDEQVKTASRRIIAWCGDQLTVERLRGLFKFRGQDFNSFDRLDWIVTVCIWMRHAQQE